MTLSVEQALLAVGLLVIVGFLFSFELAAVLGALTVVGLAVGARQRSAGQCPQCGAKVKGSASACERCGHEF
jgi:hypothetical protein